MKDTGIKEAVETLMRCARELSADSPEESYAAGVLMAAARYIAAKHSLPDVPDIAQFYKGRMS